MMLALLLSALLLGPVFVHAQGAGISGQVIAPAPPTGTGGPAPFATVRVCPGSGSGTPCSPLSNLFSDPGLTQPVSNPATTDANGNYSLWVAPSTGGCLVQVTPVNGVVYDYFASCAAGTITTVGLSMPGVFYVSNNPLTGTGGTIGVTFAAQSANLVLGTCGNNIITFCSLVASQLPTTLNAITSPSINGVLNPATCGSTSPPSWCNGSGTDIGAATNAAITQLGTCGEISIPAGTYSQSTPIVKPRCVKLHGASAYGTIINFTPTSSCSIVISDVSGGSNYPPGAVEDLKLVGPTSASTTCGVYMGGSDGSSTSPSTSIDPAANFGDHANINRVFVTQFGVGVQYGFNTWRDTLFESVVASNGVGVSMPGAVAGSMLSGENISITDTSVQNNSGIGLSIGNGVQVNFNLTDSSFDFNGPAGCTSGTGCAWQIQNGTTSGSQTVVAMKGGYITAADHWIQNFGYFYAAGNYVTGGQQSATLGYLIDNENSNNFTVDGGQWFNGGSGALMNGAGACSTWTGALITGGGGPSSSSPVPFCTYIDRFGNAAFISILSANEFRTGASFATIKQGTIANPSAVQLTAVANAGSGSGWELASNNNGGGQIFSGLTGVPSLNFGTFTGAVGAETYTQRAMVDANGFGVGNGATVLLDPFNVDPSGDLSTNGTISTASTVTVENGTNIVYRCATGGGALPIGTLTISPGSCASSTDTGLRVH